MPDVFRDDAAPAKNNHLTKSLNSSLLLVAALTVLRSSASLMYFSRFFRLAVPSRRRIVDGVLFPTLMEITMRSMSFSRSWMPRRDSV